jgi:hypothetical protein
MTKTGRRGANQTGAQTSPIRRLPCLCAALCLTLAAAAAQQPSSDIQQQPGAQVHTGINSGLDTETRLDNLLADHQFLRIEGQLDQLPPRSAQFYRGILANRNNDLKKSIELLEPLVDEVAASGNIAHENIIRKALAEDYLREGDWAKAAAAYQTLASRLAGKLSSDEQDEIEMPLKMLPLAKDNPPMTVDPCDPFELQVSKNLLGLTDIPVFVDARPHTWMLDPTAPFNLIARSLAKEAGLTVTEEAVTIHTLTGRPIQVHMTVVPRFTIGGQLTLRNMTAFVFEDADYFFPQTHYQVEGVLGYPALAALGSLTITDNNTIYVRPDKQIAPAEKGDQLTGGMRFFLDGDQMIVALVGANGQERMFAIDAGGQQTYLTSRYYDEHSEEFTGQKLELYTIRGQSALAPVPAIVAETVALTAGPTTFHVHFIPVLTQTLGSAALDDIYGVLGVDALDQLGSYTFDYRTMRFTIKPSEARD